jgi:putative ABC transport system permease protein
MMGIPLIEGRHFGQFDHESSLKVAIVSERLAKRFWPGESALGKRLLPADVLRPWTPEWLTVVGVVGDVRAGGPAGSPGLDLYVPFTQVGWQRAGFLVRTASNPESIHGQVLQAVASVDPDEPANEMLTMEDLLHRTIWQRKLAGIIFTTLGSLALLLASIGIYSVVAYSVSQRAREIGIRSALGARRKDILRMVLVEGARFVLPGIAIGVGFGLVVGRVVSTVLFQVSPYDALTLIGVVVTIGLISTAACLIPANRAAQIDPLLALRTE